MNWGAKQKKKISATMADTTNSTNNKTNNISGSSDKENKIQNTTAMSDDNIEPAHPTKISFFRLIADQGVVTQEIIDYPYPGTGTEEDPYVVTWIPNDPRNPMLFGKTMKWTFTMIVAVATLAVALVSSAYTGGIAEIEKEFQIGSEVATLGVSLFVLGFAIGKCQDIQNAIGVWTRSVELTE